MRVARQHCRNAECAGFDYSARVVGKQQDRASGAGDDVGYLGQRLRPESQACDFKRGSAPRQLGAGILEDRDSLPAERGWDDVVVVMIPQLRR